MRDYDACRNHQRAPRLPNHVLTARLLVHGDLALPLVVSVAEGQGTEDDTAQKAGHLQKDSIANIVELNAV